MGDVVGLHERSSASARRVGPEGAKGGAVYLIVNKVFFENRAFPTACAFVGGGNASFPWIGCWSVRFSENFAH